MDLDSQLADVRSSGVSPRAAGEAMTRQREALEAVLAAADTAAEQVSECRSRGAGGVESVVQLGCFLRRKSPAVRSV